MTKDMEKAKVLSAFFLPCLLLLSSVLSDLPGS